MKVVLLKVLTVGITSFYTAFVLKCFWHWFVVPTLYVRDISVFQMLGLVWMVQLLTDRHSIFDDERWKEMTATLKFCVPEEKRDGLERYLESHSLRRSVSDGGGALAARYDTAARARIGYYLEFFRDAFGEVARDTGMLAAGFVLHLMIS